MKNHNIDDSTIIAKFLNLSSILLVPNAQYGTGYSINSQKLASQSSVVNFIASFFRSFFLHTPRKNSLRDGFYKYKTLLIKEKIEPSH